MTSDSTGTTPTFLGMVICDNIIQDPETKKHFLLGTTNVAMATSFPTRYPKLCVYAALTGIREPQSLSVRVVRVDPAALDDVRVVNVDANVEANHPLAVAELTLNMRNVQLPQPGEYRVQLWTGATLLGERRLMVHQLDSGTEERSESPRLR